MVRFFKIDPIKCSKRSRSE